jgi:hypothetical protein
MAFLLKRSSIENPSPITKIGFIDLKGTNDYYRRYGSLEDI